MRLFFYDLKHNQVHESLDLGEMSSRERELVEDVIKFMDKIGLTDGRYRNLALAEKMEARWSEEEKESYLVMDGVTY